jgi:hypothetical protein
MISRRLLLAAGVPALTLAVVAGVTIASRDSGASGGASAKVLGATLAKAKPAPTTTSTSTTKPTTTTTKKPDNGNNGNGQGNGGGQDHKDFAVTGAVTGLVPGANGNLVLKVSNPNNFQIEVTSITVAAGNASAQCTASNLVTTGFSGSLLVPANGTVNRAVPIKLKPTAGDGCKNASFPLTYGGNAVKP